MKFCSLSSGSSGNSLYIETDKSKFLIDAGLSGVRIQKLLTSIGVKAEDLDFIMVTHEHTDHSKGVGVLSRRFNLPVVANYDTWLAMDKTIGKIKDENIIVFKSDNDIELRDVDIHPMSIYHDSVSAVGYIIESGGKKLSVLTDTGFVSEKMKEKIKGSDLYFLEANHDLHMLETGPYPELLKKRVRGLKGHLSNIDCGNVLGEMLRGMGERVFLSHLSEENNTPEKALNTVVDYLRSMGMDTSSDAIIKVADRYKPSMLIEL